MEILVVVLAILTFGLGCFKIGYSVGKDMANASKKCAKK